MASGKFSITISECISQIQRDPNDKAKEKALQTLVSITKASPPHRNLVMQNNKAIPTILTLLKSSSSTLQRLSLSILFNLSLNPNLKSTLAEMETIQHLNDVILSRGSPLESRKLAASLICSLAMLDKNKAVFGVANTIQALLKAVSRPDGPVTHHLLSSLAELVHFHGNCTVAVRSGAVGVLLRIVENVDCEDLSGNALVILGLLSRFDEGLKALTNTANIVSRMLDVLKSRCMLSNEGAAEVLLRVFDESEERLRDAMGLPDLMFVLAELSVLGKSNKQYLTLMKKVIMKVTNHTKKANGIQLQLCLDFSFAITLLASSSIPAMAPSHQNCNTLMISAFVEENEPTGRLDLRFLPALELLLEAVMPKMPGGKA
ncbi:hypothetical protein OSB04_013877 [Centaurea solstitialis]|uniref:U-box domain-containing protein n=1 Tax=Centaurea solstitialis TaxID=347529 RepID=A0AA38TLM2_9ASTR|nr:hypothetical protein OSB04_013877 [Centaurea solstitialis]